MTLHPDTIALVRLTTDQHPFGPTLTLREQLVQLRAENLRYRDFLLKIAKECNQCGGSGLVEAYRVFPHPLDVMERVPCPWCIEVREVLR